MGFDDNDNRPIINFHKWTTKVNVWMIVGALVFLMVGALLIVNFRHREEERRDAATPPRALPDDKN